jgi:hypothetical protein
MQQRHFITAICAIFVISGFAKAADEAPKHTLPPATTAFVHVDVIPMDREHVLRDQTVVIEGERITQIGPSRATKVPRHALRIEAKGKTNNCRSRSSGRLRSATAYRLGNKELAIFQSSQSSVTSCLALVLG